MPRKTQRVYASAGFDGTTLESAQQSVSAALANLADAATHEGRIPLFDTLEIRVEKETITDSAGFVWPPVTVETFATIEVTVEGVLASAVSETTIINNVTINKE